MNAEQLRRLVDEARARGARGRRDRRLFLGPRRVAIDAGERALDRAAHARARASARSVGEVDIRFSGPARPGRRSRAAIFKRVREAGRCAAASRSARPTGTRRSAARCARCPPGATPARASPTSEARIDRETRARVARGRARERAAASASASCASAARKRYPDELVREPEPDRVRATTYDRDKVVRLPAAPARERLLRERAGRHRSQPRQPDAAPAARGGDRGAQAPRRGRHRLHHRRRLRRRACDYTNQDVFDSAWRFRSTLRLDEKIQNLRVQLRLAAAAGRLLEQLPARGAYREKDIQNERTRELAAGVSHNWGARNRRRARWSFSAHFEEQSVERRAVRQTATRSTSATAAPSAGPTTSSRRARATSPSFEVGGSPDALATRPFVRGDRQRLVVLPGAAADGDLLLRGQAARDRFERATASRAPSFSAPAATRRCAATTSRASACSRASAIVGGRRLLVEQLRVHPLDRRQLGHRRIRRRRQRLGRRRASFRPRSATASARACARRSDRSASDLAYGQAVASWRLHFSVGFTF